MAERSCDPIDSLEADDYRRVLAVLEMVERAHGLTEFRRLALDALEEHLGYRFSTFLLGGPPDPRLRGSDGITHGLSEVDMEEYIELWTGSDPFVTATATARMARAGFVELEDLGAAIGLEQRTYVERFLRRQGSSQLSLWLDTGIPSHGYVSVLERRPNGFGAHDRALLLALRPHLANLLRSHLLAGRAAPGTERLSAREREIAQLIVGGWSNREIATHLGVVEDTVKKHLTRVMSKLRLKNRTQVALFMRTAGDSTFVP